MQVDEQDVEDQQDENAFPNNEENDIPTENSQQSIILE